MNRESRAVNRESGRTCSTFEDLEVYQVAREFRKAIYQVARELPELEKFGLTSQMRRAAVSLTNNIAEGHGRFHFLDQIKFTLQSRGSLEELIDDLNISEDERYLPADRVAALKRDGWRVRQLIDGYIRCLRSQKNADSMRAKEEPPAFREDSAWEPIHDSPFTIHDPA